MTRPWVVLLLLSCDGAPSDPCPGGGCDASDSVVDPAVEGPASLVEIDTEPASFTLTNPCENEGWCDQAVGLGLSDLAPLYGRGASWVDVDGDGWEDLWLSHDRYETLGSDASSRLYRNVGDGSFELLDLGVDPAHTLSNWGGAWGDYDNDGDPDLFLTNGGYSTLQNDYLYRNDLTTTGSFTEVTIASGMVVEPWMTWGAAWADYNNDGFLDLAVVTRSVRFDAPCCGGDEGDESEPEVAPVWLYVNQGDGTFVEMSEALGIEDQWIDGKNPVWLDYDRDGWMDLYIANAGATGSITRERDEPYVYGRRGESKLYRNLAGEGFDDVTDVVFPDPSYREPVFVAAALDFDQDGWDDLYLGRGFEQDVIMLNDHAGGFEPVGQGAGLDMASGWAAHENAMGLAVGDVTGDGWPEVWVGTGWPDFKADPLMYRHEGYTLRMSRSGASVFPAVREGYNHGAAFSDLDHDGDVDMIWNIGAFALYDIAAGEDNRQQPSLWVNHGVRDQVTAAIRLVGTASNRDAVGARITVFGAPTRHYTLHNMNGFQSTNGPWTTVSFGNVIEAEVLITWPSGTEQRFMLPGGGRATVTEP